MDGDQSLKTRLHATGKGNVKKPEVQACREGAVGCRPERGMKLTPCRLEQMRWTAVSRVGPCSAAP
jgi:hypothetical protein